MHRQHPGPFRSRQRTIACNGGITAPETAGRATLKKRTIGIRLAGHGGELHQPARSLATVTDARRSAVNAIDKSPPSAQSCSRGQYVLAASFNGEGLGDLGQRHPL